MGPSLFSDGNPTRYAKYLIGKYASMGPSLFSDGNLPSARCIARQALASMGPSLFSDGNLSSGSPSPSTRALQWGRRYSATEIF